MIWAVLSRVRGSSQGGRTGSCLRPFTCGHMSSERLKRLDELVAIGRVVKGQGNHRVCLGIPLIQHDLRATLRLDLRSHESWNRISR